MKSLFTILFLQLALVASAFSFQIIEAEAVDPNEGIEHEDIGVAEPDEDTKGTETTDIWVRAANTDPAEDLDSSIPPWSQIQPSQIKVLIPADTTDPAPTPSDVWGESEDIGDAGEGVREKILPDDGNLEGNSQDAKHKERIEVLSATDDPDDENKGNSQDAKHKERIEVLSATDDPDDENKGNSQDAKHKERIEVLSATADPADEWDEKMLGSFTIKWNNATKGNSQDTKHKEWIEVLSATVESEDDLKKFAEATVATNKKVREIVVVGSKVTMKVTRKVLLFGIIPIRFTATLSVENADTDTYGRVKVRFPWLMWRAKDDILSLQNSLEGELASIGDDAPLANRELQNPLHRMQQTLQTMSNISK